MSVALEHPGVVVEISVVVADHFDKIAEGIVEEAEYSDESDEVSVVFDEPSQLILEIPAGFAGHPEMVAEMFLVVVDPFEMVPEGTVGVTEPYGEDGGVSVVADKPSEMI